MIIDKNKTLVVYQRVNLAPIKSRYLYMILCKRRGYVNFPNAPLFFWALISFNYQGSTQTHKGILKFFGVAFGHVVVCELNF
jgi:hypothetical protein